MRPFNYFLSYIRIMTSHHDKNKHKGCFCFSKFTSSGSNFETVIPFDHRYYPALHTCKLRQLLVLAHCYFITQSNTPTSNIPSIKTISYVTVKVNCDRPDPEVIKIFSCSAQLRLKFILLINVKMPTIVGILTFISRINY